MSIHNEIYESAWSDRWCLAGSVTTSAQLMPSSHSLTLIRGFDSLSPVIRSAMNAGSIIPVVEINTPTGTVTLLNAKIESISPSSIKGNIGSATYKGWIDIFSWSFGATQSGSGGHVGGGSGAGKVNMHDITFTKKESLEKIGFSFEDVLAGIHHRRR
jgi:type VI protein secretion system component Hcp